MNIVNVTSRELELEQLRRAIARGDTVLMQLSASIGSVAIKQARRRAELFRQTHTEKQKAESRK
jgi:hypothetical protein